MIKNCVKLAKEKSRDKQKDTEVARWYKSKLQDDVQRGNIMIDKVPFARAPRDNLLHGTNGTAIRKYKVIINDMPVNALYDNGTSTSCMAKSFFDTLPVKPKLMPCNRYIAGMGGKTLRHVGEWFVYLQIGRRIFWDRVVAIDNLRCKYILDQVLHRSYWFGTGYSTTGKHYITINGQVIAQSIS